MNNLNKIIINYILIFICTFFASISFAQPNSQFNALPSPDAYNLGKYYDLPVDKSNGLPNIAVPLTNVQIGSLNLPLSTSYHSTGLRVSDVSSNVGLGWSLRGIPMITRAIKMLGDDRKSMPRGFKDRGYMDIASTLSQEYEESEFYTMYHVPSAPLTDTLVYGDNEPDVYTCILLSGETFRFTLDGNGEPVAIPRNNVLIDFDSNTGIIQIVDENGIKYTFDQFEETTSNIDDDNYYITTAWYPSSISTFDDAYAINFVYEKNIIQYASKYSARASQVVIKTGGSNSGGGFLIQNFLGSLPKCGDPETICVFNYPISISKSSGLNIKEISTSDNKFKVTFENDFERDDVFSNHRFANSTKPKTFSTIQIWDQNIVSEEIHFSRSYFVANNFNSMGYPLGGHLEEAAKKRLKLDSLVFIDQQTLKEKKYLFEYYSSTIPHIADPDHDQWGFFNNAGNAGQSVGPNGLPLNAADALDYFPSQSVSGGGVTYNFNNPNIDKSSSLAGTRSTVLKSITYPTGGKTEFTYELNEFRSIETNFTISSPVSLVANQCDASNCTCTSFPSNNIDSEPIQIENFAEFFKSDISISATSNLTFHTQPQSCSEQPSFTLSIITPNGVYKSFSANIEVQNDFTAKVFELFDINPDEESDFVPNFYLFKLEAFNVEVNVAIDDYLITENETVTSGPGLRIQKIDEITNDASLSSSRTYTYNDENNETSGYLFANIKTSNYLQTKYLIDSPNIRWCEVFGCSSVLDETSSTREEITIYSDSYIPLSNFEKGIGFYTRVTEHYLNGAYTISEFEFKSDAQKNIHASFPFSLSYNSSLINKKTKKTELFDNNNTSKQSSDFRNEVNDSELIPGARFYRYLVKNAYIDAGGNIRDDRFFIRYPLTTSNVRLKSKTTILDNVSTNMTYNYRSDNAHLLPIEAITNHSDGTVQKDSIKYAHDVNQYNLLNYNLVHLPVETNQYIGTTKTVGLKTNFSTSFAGGYPRPQTIQSYNWLTDEYETEVTYQIYDNKGNPTQLTKRGWNTETYTWDYDLLKTRTYENFTWTYDYHPNSRLLQKHTEPNGLFTTYDYNGFRQLTEINQYNGKSITTLDYDFRLTDGANKITSNIAHLDGADFTTEQEFDGLGRKILDKKVGYGHNNQDVIYKTEYDNIGRLWKEYEPGFGTTLGAATTYAYEESPLNRVKTITPPAPLSPTSIDYGNANSNSLWTKTQTNALGQITKTYTDTRGRMLQQDVGKSPELASTVYDHDDRNNIKLIIPHGRLFSENDYVYKYTYDGRDNLLTKKIPEKSIITYRYDLRDLPTHFKDGIQPVVHTKYDVFGRVDQTGFVSSLTDINFTNLLLDNDYNVIAGSLGFGQLENTKVALLDETGMPTEQDITTDITNWDSYHRPIITTGNHPLNLTSPTSYKIEQSFNSLDQIKTTEVTVNVEGTNWTTLSESFYDHSGRMSEEYFTVGGVRKQICNTTKYNPWDAVETKTIGAGLQTLDYSYYSNGFLEGLNNGFIAGGLSPTSTTIPNNNTTSDLYRMKLTYDGIGNINTWQSQNRDYATETNTYTYDGLNRIKTSNSSSDNFSQSIIYEDLLGNISSITRYDLVTTESGWQKQLIDNLDYNYVEPKSSRIQNITDAANHEKGYQPNSENYSYDDNGNITYDPQRQINLNYNYHNLPSLISKPDGSKKEYIYGADGNKWQEVIYDVTGNSQKKSYIGGMEFLGNSMELAHHSTGFVRNTNAAAADNLVLSGRATGSQQAKNIFSTETIGNMLNVNYKASERIELSDGFKTEDGIFAELEILPLNATPAYEWQYKLSDHLGNQRVLFSDTNGDGSIDANTEVLQTTAYYPFGMRMEGNFSQNNVGRENKYLFNGKELDTDFGLNWYHYGARMYDPAIARWNAVDPLAEKFYPWSPYNYTYNNPLIYTDPDGRGPIKRFVKKVVKNTIKRGGKVDFKSDFIDTFNDYADAAKTFGDGVWGVDDLVTAFELITDIEADDIKAVKKFASKFLDNGGSLAKRGRRKKPNDGRNRKQDGSVTEPSLSDKSIVKEDGVEIKHYTRSGDHGPPHMHVTGGGKETKIGQNGKPIDGSPELTAAQKRVVEKNKSTVRKVGKQIGKFNRFNNN